MNFRLYNVLALICASLLIFHLWLSSTSNQRQEKAHLEALTLTSLALLLESTKAQKADLFITNANDWNRYKTITKSLLDIRQSLKYDISSGLVDFHASDNRIASAINEIISLQADISKHQNDFMKLRSAQEAMVYRTEKPLLISQRIINAQRDIAKSSENLGNLYALNHALLVLKSHAQIIWAPGVERDLTADILQRELHDSRSQVEKLLDSKKGIQAVAQRRDLLDLSSSLNAISSDLDKLSNAIQLVIKIEKAQQTISSLCSEILMLLDARADTEIETTLYIALQIAISLCFIGIITVLTFILAKQKTESLGIQQPNRVTPIDGPVKAFDLTNTLTTMDKAAKGNIALRLDEKGEQGMEISAAYNQLMSSIYRRIINIRNLLKELEEFSNLEQTNSNTEHNDPNSETSLKDWLDITFSIAGAIDQIERKTKTQSSITSELERIDTYQALLRVKIKDALEYKTVEDSSPHTSIQADTERVMKALFEEIKYFKLDRKL